MYFGPCNAGRFWKNDGVGQPAQIGPILTFNKILLNNIKIQRGGGIFCEKNCHLMLLGPHVAGHFGQLHGCRLAKYGPINFFLSF